VNTNLITKYCQGWTLEELSEGIALLQAHRQIKAWFTIADTLFPAKNIEVIEVHTLGGGGRLWLRNVEFLDKDGDYGVLASPNVGVFPIDATELREEIAWYATNTPTDPPYSVLDTNVWFAYIQEVATFLAITFPSKGSITLYHRNGETTYE
jgi:hypothetical protein